MQCMGSVTICGLAVIQYDTDYSVTTKTQFWTKLDFPFFKNLNPLLGLRK